MNEYFATVDKSKIRNLGEFGVKTLTGARHESCNMQELQNDESLLACGKTLS